MAEPINPIREILKAGVIVGLDPREMTLLALEELERDALQEGDAT